MRTRGTIRDGDVAKLRAALNEDGSLSAADADTLIGLDQACTVKDPSWADFFIEVITDYVVNQMRPEGYVVAANADWLKQRIAADNRIESRTRLELVVHVIETARWSPASLARLALAQVKEAVERGDGPLRTGLAQGPGTISAAEVALLRRILFAFGGDGNIAVTRAEADSLIEINKAIVPGMSPPEFTDLFVKAVANAVLNGIGLAVPPRAEALKAESECGAASLRDATALLADALMGAPKGRARTGGFCGRAAELAAAEAWATCRQQSSEEQALARLERQRLEIITGEEVGEADAVWLAGRLGRNGKLDGNERALLRFLKEESPVLPPALRDMAERMGNAA